MNGLDYTLCLLVTVILKSNVSLSHVDSSIVFIGLGGCFEHLATLLSEEVSHYYYLLLLNDGKRQSSFGYHI